MIWSGIAGSQERSFEKPANRSPGRDFAGWVKKIEGLTEQSGAI